MTCTVAVIPLNKHQHNDIGKPTGPTSYYPTISSNCSIKTQPKSDATNVTKVRSASAPVSYTHLTLPTILRV